MVRRILATLLTAVPLTAPATMMPPGQAMGVSAAQVTTVTGYARESTTVRELVDDLIARSARFYSSVDTVYMRGTYHTFDRAPGDPEQATTEKLEIFYRAPDRIRVDVRGPEGHRTFIADGTTVTELWHREKRYLQRPQPGDLAAYAELEWPGRTADDQTLALSSSFMGPLLIVKNTEDFIRANVVDYVLEGRETVGGRECVRLKFVQEFPDCVFNHWVDPETGLYMRTSVHEGFDGDWEVAGRHRDSIYGEMRTVSLDEVSTSPENVPDEKFRFRVPRGWKPAERTEADRQELREAFRRAEGNDSPLTGLLRRAAKVATGESTVTVKQEFGRATLDLAWWGRRGNYTEMALIPTGDSSGTSEPFLAAVSRDDKVVLFGRDGGDAGDFAFENSVSVMRAATGTSGPVLMLSDLASNQLQARRLDGTVLWTADTPDGVFDLIPQAGADGMLNRIASAGSSGLLTLSAGGEVLHTSLSAGRISTAFSIGVDRARKLFGVTFDDWLVEFAQSGEFLRRVALLDGVLLASPDDEGEAPAVLAVCFGEDDSLVLRRYGLDGAVLASGVLPLEYSLELTPVALGFCQVGEQAAVGTGRHVFVALSDGTVALYDLDLHPVARVTLAGRGGATPRTPEYFVNNCIAADPDGNGVDELFLATGAGILRAEWRPVKAPQGH